MDSRTLANKLIEHSIISDELAQKLITESYNTGRSFEEILRVKKLVDDTTVAEAKGELLKIPYQK